MQKSPLYLETGAGGQVGDSAFRGIQSPRREGLTQTVLSPKRHLATHPTPPNNSFHGERQVSCAQHHRAGKGRAGPEPSTLLSPCTRFQSP